MQKIYYIPCEQKPLWQLSWLDDFTIKAVANRFVHKRLNIPKAYSEPGQRSKMKLSAKIFID